SGLAGPATTRSQASARAGSSRCERQPANSGRLRRVGSAQAPPTRSPRLAPEAGWRPVALEVGVAVELAVRRADARDHSLLRALVEPLAAALHGAEELVEVDLERREDPVGPVL